MIDNRTTNLDLPLPDISNQLIEDVLRIKAALIALDTKHAFSDLIGNPTTVAGFGITNAYTKTEIDGQFTALVNGAPGGLDTLGEIATKFSNIPFSTLTSIPTTVSGYGITNAYTKTEVDAFIATSAKIVRSSRTSNTALGLSDGTTFIDITSGTFTQTLDAAATLGSGWHCWIRNSGTGEILIDPNAAETIDGLASFTMYPRETRLILCNGTSFNSLVISGGTAIFTTSGTFTVPPGVASFFVDVFAAGGGGGRSSSGNRDKSVGGGGGGRNRQIINRSALGSTVTITVGAGGLGATTNTQFGAAGGDSSFGTQIIAKGGRTPATNNAGGNGGSGAKVQISVSGVDAISCQGGAGVVDNAGFNAEYGGGGGGAIVLSAAIGKAGGSSLYAGGGGGGGGGISYAGGDGGLAGAYTSGGGGAGGAMSFAGAAGADGDGVVAGSGGGGGGGSNGAATGGAGGNGGIPSGGGGGGGAGATNGNGGNGGRGEVRISW